jgi:hypothetical protein
MKKHHSAILHAAMPRVCEEVYRFFPYGRSKDAFKLMWRCGMMKDLIPVLSSHIDGSGGEKSPVWKYLDILDGYETMMAGKGFEVSNALRTAVLATGLARGGAADANGRKAVQMLISEFKPPKAVYFAAALMIDSLKRLSQPPVRGKSRFVHNKDFPDALDYCRIVLRAEGKPEDTLDQWSDLYEKGTSK